MTEPIREEEHSSPSLDCLKVCRVAYSSMLQCTLAIASTHFNKRVKMSKCYGRSILEHVRAYDARTNLLILGSTWCVPLLECSSHVAIEHENVTAVQYFTAYGIF